MHSTTIAISNFEDAKRFVNISNNYLNYKMTFECDNYRIDAHSIMGILSLDMGKPVTLFTDESTPTQFYNEISNFIQDAILMH